MLSEYKGTCDQFGEKTTEPRTIGESKSGG